jgi:hypothetical protein
MYNWTDSTTMTVSSFRKPFHVGKYLHVLTLEALIGACSKLESVVIDYAMSTNMCIVTNILLLHYIFISKFHLAFSSFQVIVCWHATI